MASVTRIGTSYRWSAFHQPYRPQRNYEGFGPFTFEQRQYENALHELNELPSLTAPGSS
jgi:hypothetical protein